MTTEIKIYEQEEQALATLEDLFKDVSVDLSNKEGIDSCKDAARKFQKVRTGVEKLRKEANSEARAHIKSVDDKAKSIQARIAPLEEKFAAPLKLRTARLKAGIDDIDAVVEQCIGKDSTFIGEKLQWLETVNVDDFFEYKKDAKASLFTANDKLTDMFNVAIQKETEEAEAKKRQEEEAKRIAEEQKRQKITSRIQEIQGLGFAMFNASSSDIAATIKTLQSNEPTAEEFEDRYPEALQAHETVIANLTQLQQQKEHAEAMQTAQKPEPEMEKPEEKPEAPFALPEEEQAVFNDVVADAKTTGTGAMIVSDEGVKHVPTEEVREDIRVIEIAAYLESTTPIDSNAANAVAKAIVSGGVPYVTVD